MLQREVIDNKQKNERDTEDELQYAEKQSLELDKWKEEFVKDKEENGCHKL